MRRFGTVHSCIILKEGGRSRGFGFVTFSSHEVARQVASTTHTIFGKEFGCNLIMPNRDAKHQQVDKKNRKVYIKVKDKSKLEYSEINRIFSRFGHISDITILKESKERSGFVQYENKESVDQLLEAGTIPYKDTFITCEPCLSRKEVKKTKKPTVPEATPKGSKKANNGTGTQTVHESPYIKEWPQGKVPIYSAEYYDEEDGYYDDEDESHFVNQHIESGYSRENHNRHHEAPVTMKIDIPPESYHIGISSKPKQHNLSASAIELVNNNSTPKNPYLIELVRPPSDDGDRLHLKKTKSTDNDYDSAKLIVGARSQEGGISKSPRDSHAERNGTNFLVIPHGRVGTNTVASGDQHRSPMLRVETGSVYELMQTTDLELFPKGDTDPVTELIPKIALTKSRDISKDQRNGSVHSNRSAKKEMLGSRASKISDPDDIQGGAKYKFNLSPNSPTHPRRKSFQDEKQSSSPTRKRSFDPKEKPNLPINSSSNLLSPHYDRSGAAYKVFKSFD